MKDFVKLCKKPRHIKIELILLINSYRNEIIKKKLIKLKTALKVLIYHRYHRYIN